jgi:hypothetical protein
MPATVTSGNLPPSSLLFTNIDYNFAGCGTLAGNLVILGEWRGWAPTEGVREQGTEG